MKITPEQQNYRYRLTGYSQNGVFINRKEYIKSLLLTTSNITTWNFPEASAPTPEIIQPILNFQPDILIIGRKKSNQPQDLELLELINPHIPSIDILNLRAACRTYNLISSESRRVMLALILGPPQ
jgi:uncharacterized protein